AGIRGGRRRAVRRHQPRSRFRPHARGRNRRRGHRGGARLRAPPVAAPRRRRRGDDRRDPRRLAARGASRPSRRRSCRARRLPLCAVRFRHDRSGFPRRDRSQSDQGAARGAGLPDRRCVDRHHPEGERAVSDTPVLYETQDKISIITLNRPDKLNPINEALQQGLVEAFARADDDPATTVVVLRANGRSFCAGYDISTGAASKDPWRHDALKWHAHLAESLQFEMMPWYMRKPVIASVQGHALGGGCELTLFCDMTIAADNAQFGEPEIRFSDVGPAIVMPWIIGYKKARELLYFGDMVDAQTALALGIVNRVVPLAELQAATLTFARRLALISPEALYATKLA